MEISSSYIDKLREESRKGNLTLQEGEISQEMFNTNLDSQLNFFDKSKNWTSTQEMMSDLISHLEKHPYFKPWFDHNPGLKRDIENSVESKTKILTHKTREQLIGWQPDAKDHFDTEDQLQSAFLKNHRDLAKLLRESGLQNDVFEGMKEVLKRKAESHDRVHDAFINNSVKAEIVKINPKEITFDFTNEADFRKKIAAEFLSKVRISDNLNLYQEIESHHLFEEQEMSEEVKSTLRSLLTKTLHNRFEIALDNWQPQKEIHFGDIESFKNEFAKQNKSLDKILRSTGLRDEIFEQNAATFETKFTQQEKEHDSFIQGRVRNEMQKFSTEGKALEISNKEDLTSVLLEEFGNLRISDKESLATEIASHGLFEKELKGELDVMYQKVLTIQLNKTQTTFHEWIKTEDIDAHDFPNGAALMREFGEKYPAFKKVLANRDNAAELTRFFDAELQKLREEHEREEEEAKADILRWYRENKDKLDAHEIGGAEGLKRLYLQSGRNKKYIDLVSEDHHADDFDPVFDELFDALEEEHEKEEEEAKNDIEMWVGESDLDAHEIDGPSGLKKLYLASGRNKKYLELVGEDHHAEDFDPVFSRLYARLKAEHDKEMKEMHASLDNWLLRVEKGEIDFDPHESKWEELRDMYFKAHPKHREEMMEDHHEKEFADKFKKSYKAISQLHQKELGNIYRDINRWDDEIKAGKTKLPKHVEEMSPTDYMRAYLQSTSEHNRKEILEPHHNALFLQQFSHLLESRKTDFKHRLDNSKRSVEQWFVENREKLSGVKDKAEIRKRFLESGAPKELKEFISNDLNAKYLDPLFEGLFRQSAEKSQMNGKKVEDSIQIFLRNIKNGNRLKNLRTWEQFETAFIVENPHLRESVRNNPLSLKKLKDGFNELQKKIQSPDRQKELSEGDQLEQQYSRILRAKVESRTISPDTAIKYDDWFRQIHLNDKKKAMKAFDEDMSRREIVKHQFETQIPKPVREKNLHFYNLGQNERKQLLSRLHKELSGRSAPEQPATKESAEQKEISAMEQNLIATLANNVRERNISLSTYKSFIEWFHDSNVEDKKHIMRSLEDEMGKRTAVKEAFEALPIKVRETNEQFYELGGYPRTKLLHRLQKEIAGGSPESADQTAQEQAISEKLLAALHKMLDQHLAKKNISQGSTGIFMQRFEEGDLEARNNIIAGLDAEMKQREQTRITFEKLPFEIRKLHEDFYDLDQNSRKKRLEKIRRELGPDYASQSENQEKMEEEPPKKPNKLPLELHKLRVTYPQNFGRIVKFLEWYPTQHFEMHLRRNIINKRPEQFIPTLFKNLQFKQRFGAACQKDPYMKIEFQRGLEKLGIPDPTKVETRDIDKEIIANQEIDRISEYTTPSQAGILEETTSVPETGQDEVEEYIKEDAEKTDIEKQSKEEAIEAEEVIEVHEAAEAEEFHEAGAIEEQIEENLAGALDEPIESFQEGAIEAEQESQQPSDELLRSLLMAARKKEMEQGETQKPPETSMEDILETIDLLTSQSAESPQPVPTKEPATPEEGQQHIVAMLSQFCDELGDPELPVDQMRASHVTRLIIEGKFAFAPTTLLHTLISRLFTLPQEISPLKSLLRELLNTDSTTLDTGTLFTIFHELFLTGKETLKEFLQRFAVYVEEILGTEIETVLQIHEKAGNMIVRDRRILFDDLLRDVLEVHDRKKISKLAFSSEQPREYLEIMNVKIVFGIHLGKKISLSFHDTTLVTEEYLKAISQAHRASSAT